MAETRRPRALFRSASMVDAKKLSHKPAGARANEGSEGTESMRVCHSLDDILLDTETSDQIPTMHNFHRASGLQSLLDDGKESEENLVQSFTDEGKQIPRGRAHSFNERPLGKILEADTNEHALKPKRLRKSKIARSTSFRHRKVATRNSSNCEDVFRNRSDIHVFNSIPKSRTFEVDSPNNSHAKDSMFDNLIASIENEQNSTQNVTRAPNDKTIRGGGQSKRSASLYERKRKPHYCNITPPIKTKEKPSPWAYGDVGAQSTPKGKNHTGRGNGLTDVQGQSVLLDADIKSSKNGSVGSSESEYCDSKRSFRTRSSDFDIDTVQNGSKTICCLTSRGIHKSCDELRTIAKRVSSSEGHNEFGQPASHTDVNNKLYNGGSHIPLPVWRKDRGQCRPRSMTVSITTVTRTTTTKEIVDQSPWSNLSRSVSMTEHKVSSAGGSPASTPTSLSTDLSKCVTSPATDRSTSSLSADDTLERQDLSAWSANSADRSMIGVSERGEGFYPEPRPPLLTKAELFNPSDYLRVDERAKEADESLWKSYENLLEYLLHDLKSDIAKLRAIYLWVVSQRPLPFDINWGEIPPDSPLEVLYNIRERKATYAELLAILCRQARIPCVIVYGMAKGVTYSVGEMVWHKRMSNSWNAVYIEHGWRLVHAQWARHTLEEGYKSGEWALVESSPADEDAEETENLQMNKRTINDFYFLSDPDKFITKCLPDSSEWQLLKRPVTKTEFEELPFIQPPFHTLRLKTISHHSCIVHAENGRARIVLQIPSNNWCKYGFMHKLFQRRDSQSEGEYGHVSLHRYIFHYIYDQHAVFDVRFPTSGDFKFQIFCRNLKRSMPWAWVCDYKIICDEPMIGCKPLPVVPTIGWGPGASLEQAGMECLSHKSSIISLDGGPVTFIRFSQPRNKPPAFAVDAELLWNKKPEDANANHVTVRESGDEVVLKIAPPKDGEFALRVYTTDKSDGNKMNICNFLLSRTTTVENAELAQIRDALAEATENGDIATLSHWIGQFIGHGMEDHGDLLKAKRRLLALKLCKDITDAMTAKDLGLLDRLLSGASPDVLRQLGPLQTEAEALRSKLRRLKHLSLMVAELDQRSISEMRSYSKPPAAVRAVMTATFLLLGHSDAELQKWSQIQALISRHGSDSVKRRIEEYRPEDVSPAVVERVRYLLQPYDLEAIQIASTGAATFYQMVMTMAGD